MDKCVLEHCEFQRGGQCCLCCPKGLDGRNRRRAAYDRIQECIAKLRRVKAKTKQVDDRMVPVGIHTDGHMYRATIGYEGKIIHLASSLSLETVVQIRADAVEAKKNNTFEQWLENFKTEKKARKKAKKTAEKEVLPDDAWEG